MITVESVLDQVKDFARGGLYDGAIPHNDDFVPFQILTRAQVDHYRSIWLRSESEINKDMKSWLEECCAENPQRRFVSSEWIPFAHFNDGSHIFVVIGSGQFSGTVLGIYSGPYAVVKAGEDLSSFLIESQKHVGKVI